MSDTSRGAPASMIISFTERVSAERILPGHRAGANESVAHVLPKNSAAPEIARPQFAVPASCTRKGCVALPASWGNRSAALRAPVVVSGLKRTRYCT